MSSGVRYVVAFPRFAASDRAWIDALRVSHEPARHAMIAPHVTLVFASAAVTAEHVTAAVAGSPTGAIDGELTSARAVGDDLFLTIARGASELAALHDRLYTGPLAAELRHDLPYVPHVTIGRAPDAARIAGELDASGIRIAAPITELVLIEVDDGVVATRATIPLAPA